MIGGDKSTTEAGSRNWNEWYNRYVPIADDLYEAHVNELRDEGLL